MFRLVHTQGDTASDVPLDAGSPEQGQFLIEKLLAGDDAIPDGCWWKLITAEHMTEPRLGFDVIWEYHYPNRPPFGGKTTGFQLVWRADPVRQP